LLGKVGSRDINSVAGVLKLYFRELREPLFPVQLFDELIACSKIDVNGEYQSSSLSVSSLSLINLIVYLINIIVVWFSLFQLEH